MGELYDILLFWAGAGLVLTVLTIGTCNSYSRFYWRKMSNKQKTLMVFLCGPLPWMVALASLFLIPVEKLSNVFNKFFDKLK